MKNLDFKVIFAAVISLSSIAATCYGVLFFADTRYPFRRELVSLQQDLQLERLERLLAKAEERMYRWRRLHERYPNDKEIKRKYEEAKREVEELRERIRRYKERTGQ